MQISSRSRISLRATTYGLLFLLYMPLLLIFILSFNTASSLTWPPRGFFDALVVDFSGCRECSRRIDFINTIGVDRNGDRHRFGFDVVICIATV
ncbi:hypothetical protein EMGBS4_19840 [Acidimicrobiaceae bacterium]|nr:hypothetical protein EMGBS4_19840 [Acidimicrobiaceae bacterium]